MLFVAALLAFPAPFRRKRVALVVCVPLLSAINRVRVASLFLTGIHAPDPFQVMHMEVWQVLYIGTAIGVFGAWLAWTRSRPAGPPQPARQQGG